MSYNNVIGYISTDRIEIERLKATVHIADKIISQVMGRKPGFKNILIAGCGDGSEAYAFHQYYNAPTVGIDVTLDKKVNDGEVSLFPGDLKDIDWLAPDSFSFIYSYHVLEHVGDHIRVLSNLSKVLAKEGLLFIGFPNKNRAVGYIGTNMKVSLYDKLKWNLQDYKMRVTGKFDNKYGAHAGFSEKEFIRDASVIFRTVIPVRNSYFLLKYAKYEPFIKFLIKSGLSEIFFPSNYYICTNNLKQV